MTPSPASADARLLLLDKHQVDALLSPDDMLRAVREAFVLHSEREGRVFPVVREPLKTDLRTLRYRSARVPHIHINLSI